MEIHKEFNAMRLIGKGWEVTNYLKKQSEQDISLQEFLSKSLKCLGSTKKPPKIYRIK